MNREVVTEIRDQIWRDPRSFNMDFWARETPCGSTFCIAGHALLVAGWLFVPSKSGQHTWQKGDEVASVVDTGIMAAAVLGLDAEEDEIFHAGESEALAWLQENALTPNPV